MNAAVIGQANVVEWLPLDEVWVQFADSINGPVLRKLCAVPHSQCADGCWYLHS